MGDKMAVLQAIRKIVKDLYGADTSMLGPLSNAATFGSAEGSVSALVASDAEISTRPPILATPGGGITVPDWSVRVRIKQYELDEAFSVVIFLGDVPEDTDDWFLSPSYAGDHSVLVNSSADYCENCQVHREMGTVTEGFVHLNKILAARSGLSSFDDAEVVPYLENNLHWRILQVRRLSVPLTPIFV